MFVLLTNGGFSLSFQFLSRWDGKARLVGCLALIAAAAVACGGGDVTATPEGFGTVQGTVWFVGAPCPPELSQGPPCDGPYPDYQLRILRDSDESLAAFHVTDANGQYTAVLPAGRYLIRTRAGIAADTFEETRFTVIPGDTLTLQLTVDTGIR
jgi:hypothetical protein